MLASDHRRLGQELDLFSVQDGLVLWHPRGALVRKQMEDYWREEHLRRGYDLVVSPHIGKAELWQTSGHLDFYKESMFEPMGEYYCKPMNCPFHAMIFKSRKRSYRELPLRLAELGTVYRYERAGALHGLLRVRGFTQDDSHIFCSEESIDSEIAAALKFALDLLLVFGFSDHRMSIGTRPADAVGDPAMWERAIASCKRAVEGMPYSIDEGGGAFYGPKIDVQIKDSAGRWWQCSTVQFDFNIPQRFGLSYVGPDNASHVPFVVHRALFGSLERFFGMLIEHYAGVLPLWLAPVQGRVLAVGDGSYASEVARAGRLEVDDDDVPLGAKVKAARQAKVPLIVVVGDKEAAARSVNVRGIGEMPLDDFVSRLRVAGAERKVAL